MMTLFAILTLMGTTGGGGGGGVTTLNYTIHKKRQKCSVKQCNSLLSVK